MRAVFFSARPSTTTPLVLLAEPTETGGILVDPASSHMLVSKIKPCMSKFTPSYGETANGSLNQSRFLR